MDATFLKIVQVMLRQLNSEHRQQQLFSQMQSNELEKFMKDRKHDSLSDGLDGLVAGISRFVPQPHDQLNTEINKSNLLCEALINQQCTDIAVIQRQDENWPFQIF